MTPEFVAAAAALLQKSAAAAGESPSAAKAALRTTRRLHASIAVAGRPPQSPFLLNNLIAAYAKCRVLSDARKVFDSMLQRSVVSYNALISALSRDQTLAQMAFHLLKSMASAGLRPNSSTISSLLHAASAMADDALGTALHARAIANGLFSNVNVQTALLVMYSTCGLFDRSRRVFYAMPSRDAVAWNAFILAHSKRAEPIEALKLFVAMKRAGVPPTGFTFSIAINACSKSGEESSGAAVHGQIVKAAASADDLPLQNAMLDMYASRRDMASASSVFKLIRSPDLVSWNSILAGFSTAGDGDKTWELFKEMRASTAELLPDEYTFSAVISAVAAAPPAVYGKTLQALSVKSGLERNPFVGSPLLRMYFQSEDPTSARKLFEGIPLKDAVLWTDMILGHGRCGEGEAAAGYLCKMLAEGHAMDSFSICGALNFSAGLPSLKQGESFHGVALKTGLEADACVCSSLVDMYAKNGDLGGASAVFDGGAAADVETWNAILGGHGLHGEADAALKLFEKMVGRGVEPDQVSFLSLLSACDHGGLVDRGRAVWAAMVRAGLQPGPKHYTSMVSLLSRAGLLREAEELILSSPFGSAMAELWRCLLSSCVFFGDLPRGVRAGNWVLEIDPDDGPALVLLSNLFSMAGEWDAMAGVRRRIRTLAIDKDPGLSWIEISGVVSVFSADDNLRPELQKIAANIHSTNPNTHFHLLKN
ncbi:pentatricopeptide repeat (PPR) superfamily protein [Wolffia australiana]